MNDRQSLVAARLEKLSNELGDVERERREAEARLTRTDQAVADASFSPDLPEVLESRVIGDHKRELLAAQEERSALLQRYKPKHPRLQAVERRIHAIESQIATEVEAIYRGVRQHAHRLARHQADVSARLAAQTDELLALERASIQYEILKNEADNIRRTHDAIVARLKEVEVINDHQASNVHALGAPEVSKAPVRPRIALNLALALLLGLLASAGAAFAADALDSSIKTPADAARILGLPILGLVPRLEGKRPARAAADPETFDSRSTLSEAFRTIRTNFTFSEAGRDVRSLVVTSATPEEGKSLVSLNLAVSMGRAGKRVLLVDADLRRPRLHRAFEVTAEEGLSSVLVGARQLDELVLPTRADNVWLLPCGLIPPNPVELLASERMPECLRAALARFDLVLIDSPPVGVVSDACVLATQADRVVFVVRSFKAHRGLCRRAAAQLAAVGARIAGCVVNHCDVRADRYGQYDYEYSYLSRYDYAERGAASADAAAP
jgi:capsular exopolysaccharide synthesis family protein